MKPKLLKCTSFRELDYEKLWRVYSSSMNLEEETSFYTYLREDFFSGDRAVYYILEESGEYRSALRVEPYQDGVLFSGVETHPDYRRRGYGSALLSMVLSEYDTPVYSHIRKSNAASVKLHERCGFHMVLDYGKLLDGSVDSRYITMAFYGKEFKKMC